MAYIDWKAAFETRDAETFMTWVFPREWRGVIARILETGVEMTDDIVGWAPRWSPVSPTVRGTPAEEQRMHVKSVLYRAHDFLHQVWGLPVPRDFSEEEQAYFTRVNMCGEVAVLTISEFFLAAHLVGATDPNDVIARDMLLTRNALAMRAGPLWNKSMLDIAGRLDDLLHKQRRPRWVRGHPEAEAFCDDYVPMLADDRTSIKRQWDLMVAQDWKPHDIPDVRPAMNLDGLELTRWMIQGFEHLIDTDTSVDRALMEFNRARRAKIILPEGW